MGCSQSVPALPDVRGSAAYTIADSPPPSPGAPSTRDFAPLPPVDTSSDRILPDALSDIHSDYVLGEVLGTGNLGTVRAATQRATGRSFAVKSISKARLLREPEHREAVHIEVHVLKRLNGHPGTVALEGTYEDDDEVHLVMERCTGGELFDRCARGARLGRGRPMPDKYGMLGTKASVTSHCPDYQCFSARWARCAAGNGAKHSRS